MLRARLLATPIVVLSVSQFVNGETASLRPVADNTLFQSAIGDISSGAGSSLFAGITNSGELRRALLRFDLSTLPPTAVVNGATLRVTTDRVGPGGVASLNLHAVAASWGEGTSSGSGGGGLSTTGDATWVHRFFNSSLWTTPGGDFAPVPLAAKEFVGLGDQTFASTPEFAAAVQSWLSAPASNFGLIIKEQAGNPIGSATRFFSREATNPLVRPVLTVDFTRAVTSWASDADGNWNSASNWTNGTPNSFGIIARLANAITAARTIVVSNPTTIGQLQFDSINSYTLTGGGGLALDNGADFTASITASSGSHTIDVPVTTGRPANIDVAASAGLRVASVESTSLLTKRGDGLLELGTGSVNDFVVEAGQVKVTTSVGLAAASIQLQGGSIYIESGGILQSTTAPGVEAALQARVADIVANRIQTVSGMAIGSARVSDLGVATFLGRPVPAHGVLLRKTFHGDTNLDGSVNFDDLLALAQNYGTSVGSEWVDADSDRDGDVDFDDLLVLAQSYGSSLTESGVTIDVPMHERFESDWQLARSLVPEPTAMLVLGAGACLRRRR